MLPTTKKYIQIPSHDYLKMKRLLESLSKEFSGKARLVDKYCPEDIKQSTSYINRYADRYLEINRLISELELHSRVIEDY